MVRQSDKGDPNLAHSLVSNSHAEEKEKKNALLRNDRELQQRIERLLSEVKGAVTVRYDTVSDLRELLATVENSNAKLRKEIKKLEAEKKGQADTIKAMQQEKLSLTKQRDVARAKEENKHERLCLLRGTLKEIQDHADARWGRSHVYYNNTAFDAIERDEKIAHHFKQTQKG